MAWCKTRSLSAWSQKALRITELQRTSITFINNIYIHSSINNFSILRAWITLAFLAYLHHIFKRTSLTWYRARRVRWYRSKLGRWLAISFAYSLHHFDVVIHFRTLTLIHTPLLWGSPSLPFLITFHNHVRIHWIEDFPHLQIRYQVRGTCRVALRNTELLRGSCPHSVCTIARDDDPAVMF